MLSWPAPDILQHQLKGFHQDNWCLLPLPSQLTNLTEIYDQISGMARCPYSPQHNSTALLTANGELYAATAMDFPGRDPAIYRSLGALPPLRTAQYNSKWLNGKDPVACWAASFGRDALVHGTLSHSPQKHTLLIF